MSAVIVVVPAQHYAISDASGVFQIAGVPAGEYLLRVFHERATESTLQSLERRVTVGSDSDVGAIRVSESGYIEVGHKNKFGREYPAQPRETGLYLGGK